MLAMRLTSVATERATTGNTQNHEGIELLNHYGISYLYHITHINNLPSILASGLLSHSLAHQQCDLTDISDLEVNARRTLKDPIFRRHLHEYVPTYFTPRNPMSYLRRELANELVILKLNRELLLQADSLFTDGNAACCQTHFFNNLNALDQLDWDCLNSRYWNDYIGGKRKRCAEMLIPNSIKTQNIMQIAVNGSSTLRTALQSTGKSISVVLQPELFF
ncbi:hypothetical protein AU255_08960 [Methyloprofundus sedimenti]|uniref:DarT domain-containing protein n=1 Tax=Methyloprofundus sedimenti TaxID=1420851 RepID=A0A1V8M8W4_9GAMM|nr:DUF4433 domain-containing protein [Methyloprofundus sedimenti]OQK17968.1 hypothetical protein AU255_08960 [Methyloprofundus sedimenti]